MRKAAAPLSYATCPRTGLSAFLPERVLSRRTGGTYTPAPMSAVTCEARGSASYVSEGSALVPRRPRLLDTVRDALRLRHYSRRTERAYVLFPRGGRKGQRVDAEPGAGGAAVSVRPRPRGRPPVAR